MGSMESLKWLGAVCAALGIVFLFFALTWTEWPQLFVGAGLLALGAVVWRIFAGLWPQITQGRGS
jgi:hypothetical protein